MADPKSEKKTLIEEGTQFKGSLSSTCGVVVRGAIQGDVAAPSLTVSPTGAVHGTVVVGELRSEGEVAGELDAETLVLSGTVKDQTVIRAKSLEVKLSPANGKMQLTFGECTIEAGNPATKETAIANATAKPESVAPPAGE